MGGFGWSPFSLYAGQSSSFIALQTQIHSQHISSEFSIKVHDEAERGVLRLS